MTKEEEEEEFYKSLVTAPRSMQGDYAHLIKANGEKIWMKPEPDEYYDKAAIVKLIGGDFIPYHHGNCLMVYRANISMSKSNYNAEASRIINSPIYGDVIYAPSEFFILK
jgi:hypothetical protein